MYADLDDNKRLVRIGTRTAEQYASDGRVIGNLDCRVVLFDQLPWIASITTVAVRIGPMGTELGSLIAMAY